MQTHSSRSIYTERLQTHRTLLPVRTYVDLLTNDLARSRPRSGARVWRLRQTANCDLWCVSLSLSLSLSLLFALLAQFSSVLPSLPWAIIDHTPMYTRHLCPFLLHSCIVKIGVLCMIALDIWAQLTYSWPQLTHIDWDLAWIFGGNGYRGLSEKYIK